VSYPPTPAENDACLATALREIARWCPTWFMRSDETCVVCGKPGHDRFRETCPVPRAVSVLDAEGVTCGQSSGLRWLPDGHEFKAYL
jgi:hypothetical protein